MPSPTPRLVVRRLEKAYGSRPRPKSGRNPLRSLIGTILSQNTNDRNSGLAMDRLERGFPDLAGAADAPLKEIESAIRPAGLHRQKARSIRAVLRAVREDRGRVSLDFLRRWPDQRVRDYLLDLPGVGPKTAACVLLFALRRPVLPVDTHVHRVSRRLGLIPETTTAEGAHDALGRIVPDELTFAFHVLLIEHGRRTCRARRPACPKCLLKDVCPSAVR